MPTGCRVAGALLTVAVGLTIAGCEQADISTGRSTRTDVPSPSRASAGLTAGQTSPPPGPTTSTPARPDTEQEDRMLIRLTIGDRRFQATLADSAASRDLVAQLPLTLKMVDHGSVEKTGALPAPLSLDSQPDGADPDVGDVGYYAPGNDFVLYYGDQSYYDGIVILGRLDDDAAQSIASMNGSITATIETVAN
jgi:hypothetical protein